MIVEENMDADDEWIEQFQGAAFQVIFHKKFIKGFTCKKKYTLVNNWTVFKVQI